MLFCDAGHAVAGHGARPVCIHMWLRHAPAVPCSAVLAREDALQARLTAAAVQLQTYPSVSVPHSLCSVLGVTRNKDEDGDADSTVKVARNRLIVA